MPKNNKLRVRRRGQRSSRRKQNGSSGDPVSQPPRALSVMPVGVNPVMKIRRAIRRSLAMNSTTIDGSGTSPTMQFSFAPGATDYRINGVSVYSTAVPSSAEFTNLFDTYRVSGVVFRIDIPAAYSNGGTTPIVLPNCYFAPDYNDSGDAQITDLLQYPQVQLHNFYKDGYNSLMISLKPKPLRDVAGSGLSTGYSTMEKVPWIRTSEFSIPHYGLKLAFDYFGFNQTTNIVFVITIWYDLEFTNPK